VSAAASVASEECGRQFSLEPWDCPADSFYRHMGGRKDDVGVFVKNEKVEDDADEKNLNNSLESQRRRRQDQQQQHENERPRDWLQKRGKNVNSRGRRAQKRGQDHLRRKRKGANKRAVQPLSNRESAFVHAIASAAIAHTLTRNCSLGNFGHCGCDNTHNGKKRKRNQIGNYLGN